MQVSVQVEKNTEAVEEGMIVHFDFINSEIAEL